ncbi:MAG: hypothetical protein MZV64_41495 [Ignavibacteriales bacterium]|nr:hypothetical protein [Ignavibacteriales bacterium]
MLKLIVHSTEQLATYTGDAIGGLLNATFGNFPELIIAVVALKAGLYTMVLASIVGAILANLLLALGLSFFIGGTKHHIQEYNPASARVYASMMFMAVISLAVPSSFNTLFRFTGCFEARKFTKYWISNRAFAWLWTLSFLYD